MKVLLAVPEISLALSGASEYYLRLLKAIGYHYSCWQSDIMMTKSLQTISSIAQPGAALDGYSATLYSHQ
ncbi:hypothetical protein [Desulfosarcina sp. BuS5]|uniref:hypothetical protein n=1 Tax=Desulfosarcina sp. BuS5 TaxID=933262 RepID=UPI002377DE27|nr:hypothetical protein [Desulfosarcina sp. BuS5]